MELKILNESKTSLLLEIKGEDHTLCYALKEEIWNDKDIKAAAFRVKHPLVGVPELVVETNKEDPKKAVSAAAKRLSKTFEKMNEMVKKEIK